MSDVPVQLVVAAFPEEHRAKEVWKALKEAKDAKLIKVETAARLRKDDKGKLHITESADLGGRKGAAIGGIGGAAIAAIAGATLWVPAAVGAVLGGLAALMKDSGFSDERLKKIGEGLKPGSSAIVAVVEHQWVEQVAKELAEAGADALTESLSADIASRLEAGEQVAYSALATQEGFAAGRLAGSETAATGGTVILDDTGAYGGRFVATERGFAVETLSETEQGTVHEVAAGTEEGAAYGASVATEEGIIAGGVVSGAEETKPEQPKA